MRQARERPRRFCWRRKRIAEHLRAPRDYSKCSRNAVERSSCRGGGRHGALGQRLLPSRQCAQRAVPALDLAIGLDRVLSLLGKIKRSAETEVRQREPFAGHEFSASELIVQYLCCA